MAEAVISALVSTGTAVAGTTGGAAAFTYLRL